MSTSLAIGKPSFLPSPKKLGTASFAAKAGPYLKVGKGGVMRSAVAQNHRFQALCKKYASILQGVKWTGKTRVLSGASLRISRKKGFRSLLLVDKIFRQNTAIKEIKSSVLKRALFRLTLSETGYALVERVTKASYPVFLKVYRGNEKGGEYRFEGKAHQITVSLKKSSLTLRTDQAGRFLLSRHTIPEIIGHEMIHLVQWESGFFAREPLLSEEDLLLWSNALEMGNIAGMEGLNVVCRGRIVTENKISEELGLAKRYYHRTFDSYKDLASKEGVLTEGVTPLIHAVQIEDEVATLAFLRSGMDPNHLDEAGFSSLHYALMHKVDASIVAQLLKAGGDLHKHSAEGGSAIFIALHNLDFAFLDQFANVEDLQRPFEFSGKRVPPLHYCAGASHHRGLDYLLSRGVDRLQKCSDGKYASSYAQLADNPLLATKLACAEVQEEKSQMMKKLSDEMILFLVMEMTMLTVDGG